jgi:hypothetical protein
MQTADPAGAQWYVPKSQLDKPEDQQVRYKIRGLVGTEAMDVNFHDDGNGRLTMSSRGGTAALRAGLLGWEKRTGRDGQPLDFDADARNWKANIDSLAPMDAVDLAIEIWNRTFLTEEARKN